MEDASKKNVFNAYFEGDQSNRFDATCSYPKYVILKSTPDKPNTFRVIPCDDWYTFKREQTNPTLSLEEAEKIMKERMKGERKADAETATATAAPIVAKVPKFMMIMKEEPQKETNIKQDFNATGDVEIEEDDEGLGNSWKTKKKEKKGEDFDFEDTFDDDNKEDRFTKNTDFDDKKNLSAESKDIKKLMREKNNQEGDDFSDDEEREFPGLEELLEKKVAKETKPGEKRPADTQTPPNAKKPRTEGATPNGKNPVSEKEIEKQIREYLSVHGKVPLNKVITKFRDVATISKQSFRDVLKRLVEAKQENKVTYLYLKDDQYREFR
jgi:hypothetical protein